MIDDDDNNNNNENNNNENNNNENNNNNEPLKPHHKRNRVLQEYRSVPPDRTMLQRQSSMRKPNSSRSLLRKSVSFDDTEKNIIVPIEHVSAIPKRELSRRWMSERDFEKIQSENNVMLQYLDLGRKVKDTKDWTPRGLERHTELGMYQFRENRRDALSAVLYQQDLIWRTTSVMRQDNADATNDIRIARAYRQETKQTQQIANAIAQQDEKEVDEYLADCTLERIRKEQQKRKHALVKRLLVQPARQLTKSLSLKSVISPQTVL